VAGKKILSCIVNNLPFLKPLEQPARDILAQMDEGVSSGNPAARRAFKKSFLKQVRFVDILYSLSVSLRDAAMVSMPAGPPLNFLSG